MDRADAKVALCAVERERATGTGQSVDQWGDLSALRRATTTSTMNRPGEQERASEQ